jgi:hypothetical protein
MPWTLQAVGRLEQEDYGYQMVTTLLAVIGALVASLAALAGAVQAYLVRKQNEHSANVAIATLYQQIARQFVDFDVFFVDRPHLSPYFFENRKPPRSAPRNAEVYSTTEMIFDLAECCHANASVLGSVAYDWDKYFHQLYQSSPALRAYTVERGHLYPPSVVRAFRSDQVRPPELRP